MGRQIKMASNGRVVVPIDVRRQLGLEDGGDLTLDVTEDGLVLSTHMQKVRAVQRRFQELTKGNPKASVDDFLREKREEYARELEKEKRLHGG